jgi:hypothetical protein
MYDFLSLAPDKWVESVVIDLYFSMLNFRELSLTEEYLGKKKNFYYNSSLYHIIVAGKNKVVFESKSLLGVELLNYSKLYIPVHLLATHNCNHWLLCEIQLNDKNIIISTFDSSLKLNVVQDDEILSIFEKWIKDELIFLSRNITDIKFDLVKGTSFQQKKDDCGIFVIFNALFLSDGVHSKLTNFTKTNVILKEIIPNARCKIAMDIERGYVQDFRLTSCYPIQCYIFPPKKKTIKIKSTNKHMAELCAFVGSKNNPINLVATEDEENRVVVDSLINLSISSSKSHHQQQPQKKQEEEYLINKWRFESYKAQIIILSNCAPHFVVLSEFYNIDEPMIMNELLDTLTQMENNNDPDLKVVAQQINEEINDNKRFHYHTNISKTLCKLPKSVQKFLAEIKKSITSVLSNIPDINPVDISILYSKSGCVKQKQHTDYDTETAQLRGFAEKSFFGVFALMDNTTIFVQDDQEISIPKGCLFMGRGDLLHAGSSYENKNVRLHFYLDSAKNINQNDRGTYFDYEEDQKMEVK